MLDANPRLSAGAVRAVLEFTAQHLTNTNLLTQGAGQLNALGAVRLARLIEPRIGLGDVWLKSQGGLPEAHDVLFGEPIAWAKNIVWGERVLLGDSAYLHLAAWNDNIVWGQTSDNIVWGEGDNIVWGENADVLGYWADNTVWGFWDASVDWTTLTRLGADNIVWGQDYLTNIVWGESLAILVIGGQQ